MIAKRAMMTMAEEEEDTGQLLLLPPPREAKTKRMDTILAAQKGGCKSIPKPAATTEGERERGRGVTRQGRRIITRRFHFGENDLMTVAAAATPSRRMRE